MEVTLHGRRCPSVSTSRFWCRRRCWKSGRGAWSGGEPCSSPSFATTRVAPTSGACTWTRRSNRAGSRPFGIFVQFHLVPFHLVPFHLVPFHRSRSIWSHSIGPVPFGPITFGPIPFGQLVQFRWSHSVGPIPLVQFVHSLTPQSRFPPRRPSFTPSVFIRTSHQPPIADCVDRASVSTCSVCVPARAK